MTKKQFDPTEELFKTKLTQNLSGMNPRRYNYQSFRRLQMTIFPCKNKTWKQHECRDLNNYH